MNFLPTGKGSLSHYPGGHVSSILFSKELTDVLKNVHDQIPANLDTALHSTIPPEAKDMLKRSNDMLKTFMDRLAGEFNLPKQGLHLKMGRYAPHGRYKPYIWGAFIPNKVKAPSHTTPQLYIFRSSRMFGWGLCPSDKARKDSTFMAIYKRILNENRTSVDALFAEGFVARTGDDDTSEHSSDIDAFFGSSTLLFERYYPTSNLPSEDEFEKAVLEDFKKLIPLYNKIVSACVVYDLLEKSSKSEDQAELFEKWDEWFDGANDVARQEVPEYLQTELGKEWDNLSHLWTIGRREALKAFDFAKRGMPIPEELIQALLFGRLRRTAYTGAWRSGVKESFAKILLAIDAFVQKYPNGCDDTQYDSLMERVKEICGFKVESFVTRFLCDLAPNVYLPYGQFTVSALRSTAKLLGQTPSKNLSDKNYESMCQEARRLCELVPDLPKEEKLYVFDHFLYWINLEYSGDKQSPKTQTTESISDSAHFWKISCGRTGRYSAIHKSKGLISIGWGEGLDPRKFDTLEQLHKAYESLGDQTYDAGHAARQCWTFAREIKKGDYIFGYGTGTVLMVGIDQGEYDFINVEKWAAEQDGFIASDHRHIRRVKWLSNTPVETIQLNPILKKKIERNQTIIPLTKEEGEEILNLAGVSEEVERSQPELSLSIDSLCERSLKSKSFFETIERRLLSKRQVVFFGPPGTSKTHIAKIFAEWFSQGGQVASVQFHPSYSYEDFIEGYRPSNDSTSNQFKLDTGVFKDFCKKALAAQPTRHVFIIDEINRGNLPQIFGELLHLLEYRNEEITLPYSKSPFVIPDNVFIVATMNSADRSIAMVDYALRRRFEFFTFPADSVSLRQFLEQHECKLPINNVVAFFEQINSVVGQELGKHYQVGHTYFMKTGLTEEGLRDIWNYSVLPLLEEYFFDNPRALEALDFDKLWTQGSIAA